MNYQICTRCIMDTSDPKITFDLEGKCNHCTNAITKLKNIPIHQKNAPEILNNLVAKIKEKGKNKKYDCIIGLSGGVDSTNTALKVKKLGLNPLAIHFDNSWNSELANSNIENICKILEIDLYTYVVNWKEFKDIQLSFIKASTPDWEIPTDHAIYTILSKMASKHGVKYILAGTNEATESILPSSWSYGHSDWKYIKNVHKLFGKVKIKTFPHYSLYKRLWWMFIKKIEFIPFLDYIEYNKDLAKEQIIKELNWRDYGGKHHESIFTKIYQSYFLPVKFGFNKKRAHLSSLIIANQISREQALIEIAKSPYDERTISNDIEYFINKFELSNSEFEEIMKAKNTSFNDYPNNENSGFTKIIYKLITHIRTLRRNK